MLLEFCFDPRGIANKKKFIDVTVIPQRHNGAGNEVRRAKITAHRVEGDLHQSETLRGKTIDCKAKFVAASLCGWWLEPTSPTARRLQLLTFQRQHLSPAIIATRWT